MTELCARPYHACFIYEPEYVRCIVASEQLKVFLVGVSSVSHRGVFVKSTYALCGRNLRPVSVQGSATIRCVQPLVGRTVAVINSKSKMTVCEIVVIGYLYSGRSPCAQARFLVLKYASLFILRQVFLYSDKASCTQTCLLVLRQIFLCSDKSFCTQTSLLVLMQVFLYSGKSSCTKASLLVLRQVFLYSASLLVLRQVFLY